MTATFHPVSSSEAVRMIAGREITTRIRSKAFIWTTVALVAGVVLGGVILHIATSNSDNDQHGRGDHLGGGGERVRRLDRQGRGRLRHDHGGPRQGGRGGDAARRDDRRADHVHGPADRRRQGGRARVA